MSANVVLTGPFQNLCLNDENTQVAEDEVQGELVDEEV